MGFTTGLIGGFTFTTTVLYLSLHLHRSNRQRQSLLLTQQKALLVSVYDPEPIVFETPAYEIREAGLTEQLKDRWNRELENVVRNVQETDWQDVRARWERRIGNVWGNLKESEVGKEVEERLKENVLGAKEEVEKGVKQASGQKRLLEIN